MKRLASIISTIFHPLLMPTIGLFLIYNTGSHLSYVPYEIKKLSYMIVFISSFILPLSIIPLLLQLNAIKSVQMESSRERLLPTFFAGFFYLLGYFFLKRLSLPAFIPSFILGSLVTIVLAMGISFFWKISIHMIGIGGVVGALLLMALKFGVDVTFLFCVTIIVAGLIGSSRLYLKAHSLMQVYAGFLHGFIVILIIVGLM